MGIMLKFIDKNLVKTIFNQITEGPGAEKVHRYNYYTEDFDLKDGCFQEDGLEINPNYPI